MTTNLTPGKPVRVWPYRVLAWGALVFVLVVVPVTLALLLARPWARARYLDSYLSVALPYLLLVDVMLRLRRGWAGLGRRARRVLIGLLPFLCIAAVGSFWLEWPDLPWSRIDAERTADEFMTALNSGDISHALSLLSPMASEATNAEDLQRPEARPMGWHLELTPRDRAAARDGVIAQGTATFFDGSELPVQIGLFWLENRWGVFQVVFGAEGDAAWVAINACCDRAGPISDIVDDLRTLGGLAYVAALYVLSTQTAKLRPQAPNVPVTQ